jgi:hypothetical protein
VGIISRATRCDIIKVPASTKPMSWQPGLKTLGVAAAAARAGTRSGGSGSSPLWTSGAVSVNDGRQPTLGNGSNEAVQGAGAWAKALPFWADHGDAFGRRLLP